MRLRSLAPLALVVGGCHLVGGPSYFVAPAPTEVGAGGGDGGAASTSESATSSTVTTMDATSSGGGSGGPPCDLVPCEKGDLRCKKPSCLSAGECGYENLSKGTTCNENLRLRCDGEGRCVKCLEDADCTAPEMPFCSGGDLGLCVECVSDEPCKLMSDTLVCGGFACVTELCKNQAMDAGETDVDCGGMCEPCAPGKGCTKFSDCVSGTCDQGICGCSASSQCSPDKYCDTGKKVCTDKKGTGKPCGGGDECQTGNCSTSFWHCWVENCCN
jgi:hypothetical protein